MAEDAGNRAPFRRFYFRGKEVEKLMDVTHVELMQMLHSRARRRFKRGTIKSNLIERLRKAKANCKPGDKPSPIKTHMRDMIIVPEMVGSNVGVYNGKAFTLVEVKADMIGHYLGEFSITYKPVSHGRPGANGAPAKMALSQEVK